MNTLIIAAHMDDEAISCGGLIQARIAAGNKVAVLAVHGRVYDYGKEDEQASFVEESADFAKACALLGTNWLQYLNMKEGEPAQVGYYALLAKIEVILRATQPDEVVIPSASDLNQDHRFLNHVCGIALRPVNLGKVTRVLEALALDGTFQSPSYFVPLTEAQLERKIEAIGAYRREARGGTSPRAPDNVRAQARVWGAACGATFAEGYRLKFAKDVNNAGGDNRG